MTAMAKRHDDVTVELNDCNLNYLDDLLSAVHAIVDDADGRSRSCLGTHDLVSVERLDALEHVYTLFLRGKDDPLRCEDLPVTTGGDRWLTTQRALPRTVNLVDHRLAASLATADAIAEVVAAYACCCDHCTA
jgi:hypothetical protein